MGSHMFHKCRRKPAQIHNQLNSHYRIFNITLNEYPTLIDINPK